MRKLLLFPFLALLSAVPVFAQGQYAQPCGKGLCLAGQLQETGSAPGPRISQRVKWADITYASSSTSLTLPPMACVTDVVVQVGPTGFDGNFAVDIGDATDADGLMANANITKTAGAISGGSTIAYGAYLYVKGTPGADTQNTAMKCYPAGGTVLIAPTATTAHSGAARVFVLYKDLPVNGTPGSTSTPTRTPTSTPTRTPTS